MTQTIKDKAREYVCEQLINDSVPFFSGDSDRYDMVLQNKNYFIQITSQNMEGGEGFDFIVTTPLGLLITYFPLNACPNHSSLEKALFLKEIAKQLNNYLTDLDKKLLSDHYYYLKRLAIKEKIDLELLILQQTKEAN